MRWRRSRRWRKASPTPSRREDPKRRLAGELARIGGELGVTPVVIGGLAVNHHGYMRLTADLDLLVARPQAVALMRRLKSKATVSNVSVDIHVEGERTSPHSTETFPSPADLRLVEVDPLPVPTLPELIALKVMSGRARDDADVVELLKRHRRRIPSLRRTAANRLRTEEARRRLDALVRRAREELARRG